LYIHFSVSKKNSRYTIYNDKNNLVTFYSIIIGDSHFRLLSITWLLSLQSHLKTKEKIGQEYVLMPGMVQYPCSTI